MIEPEGLSEGSEKLGEEVTELLEYEPGRLYVRRIVRPRYAVGGGVVIGELPTLPIPRGNAGPGLLAQLLISKYVDHLPFYRQAQQFKREGVELAESTVNGWFSAVCALLEPLYDTLVARVIGSDYVQADETPIPVMDRKKHKATHRGYFWVYHAPESGGVVFDYREGRGRAGPKEFLDRFGGILQTDGYAAYNEVGAREDIVHVGCMAHIRRKFFEAKDNDQARADEALARIGELYDIERRCREQGLHAEERLALRELEARPLMAQVKTWMEAQLTDTLPKSAIGKALHYALAQWPRMVRYLEDGRIEIDNNRIENQIRPVALGRKNYLFCGSHEGARRAAMIYSLLGTCKMNGVEPFAWLREVLTRIPDHPVNRLDEILPGRLR